MGLIMTHVPSGTTIELSKEPDLPLSIGRSTDNDVVMTGSGIRIVFKRRIDNRPISITLTLLNAVDRRLLERFFYLTVQGMKEKFNLDIQIEHEDSLQAGSTLNGSPIAAGDILPARCGDPGGPILAGDWAPQDRHIYENVRFTQSEITFRDELPENFTTELGMIQELS